MYDGLAALMGEDVGEEPCCVPHDLLLRRLAARVEAELPGVELRVREAELAELTDEERDLAIDRIVTGGEYPYVYLDGEIRWTGALDIDGIFDALQETSVR